MSTTLATVDYLPSGERTLDEWAALINGELEKSVRCIIAAGRHLAEALESLPHGSKAGLWERIPISQAEGAKLMRIAADARITNYSALNNLPPAYTTLYELAQLDDATFHAAHENGLLTPTLKYYLVFGFILLAVWMALRLTDSRTGRAWIASSSLSERESSFVPKNSKPSKKAGIHVLIGTVQSLPLFYCGYAHTLRCQ